MLLGGICNAKKKSAPSNLTHEDMVEDKQSRTVESFELNYMKNAIRAVRDLDNPTLRCPKESLAE